MTSTVVPVKMLSDWGALIERHMLHLRLIKERIVSATMLPTVFLLAFGLMFGSVIAVQGGGYKEFLIAGIFMQVMISSISTGAVGAIEDLRTGLLDRFRSLPMSGSAVLIGRNVGDTMLRAASMVPMVVVAYLMGWRVHRGILLTLAGFGILLLFGFTMCWLGALLGLATGSPESAVQVPSLLLMPAMFTSSAYVPLDRLPDWLRVIAEWNPLSAIVGAARDLWGNPAASNSDVFPVRHPVLTALIWLAATLAVIAPLASRKYRTAIVR